LNGRYGLANRHEYKMWIQMKLIVYFSF
jgi:hypothetical protein